MKSAIYYLQDSGAAEVSKPADKQGGVTVAKLSDIVKNNIPDATIAKLSDIVKGTGKSTSAHAQITHNKDNSGEKTTPKSHHGPGHKAQQAPNSTHQGRPTHLTNGIHHPSVNEGHGKPHHKGTNTKPNSMSKSQQDSVTTNAKQGGGLKADSKKASPDKSMPEVKPAVVTPQTSPMVSVISTLIVYLEQV